MISNDTPPINDPGDVPAKRTILSVPVLFKDRIFDDQFAFELLPTVERSLEITAKSFEAFLCHNALPVNGECKERPDGPIGSLSSTPTVLSINAPQSVIQNALLNTS